MIEDVSSSFERIILHGVCQYHNLESQSINFFNIFHIFFERILNKNKRYIKRRGNFGKDFSRC